MKTYLDCIPCFFRQALAAARMSSADETIQRRVLNSVALMIPDLALNATPPEIAQQVYRIVYESNGSDAPATILSQCSPEMLSYYRAADLIISKGQGNYESLSDSPGNIFFLFKVKCPVIARESGYKIDSPVLISPKNIASFHTIWG